MLYFQDYNEKQTLFKNVQKLKGLKIFLQNDYCKDTLRKRKLLVASAKNDKGAGRKVTLVHEKISIDGSLFVWAYDTNSRKATSMSEKVAQSTFETKSFLTHS